MVARVVFPSGPGLSLIFGYREEHLRHLEALLGVRLSARGNEVAVRGGMRPVNEAVRVLERMREARSPLTPEAVRKFTGNGARAALPEAGAEGTVRTPRETIMPRGERQAAYLTAIRECDVVFGVGPAGTGKTYLAVACALAAYAERRADRIVLVRPVVEAGERLGFLPGDIRDKVNPYMRPLHDALQVMLEPAALRRMVSEEAVEIAPLAYMRGRTLNRSFVILDEAQNTTVEQMKMFLTRLGAGSRMVVTGDDTQTDLAPGVRSGLAHAAGLLGDVPGLAVIRFLPADVVRHAMVQRILESYEAEGRGRRRGTT